MMPSQFGDVQNLVFQADLHTDCRAKIERLRAEVLAVINSFDNRDFSATPDQRDVIDPIRRVLNRHKSE